VFDNRPVDQYIYNMKSIGIYEIKTRIGEIFEQVNESNEPVLVTRRGKPLVKINPVYPKNESDVWEVRNSFIKNYGAVSEDLELPDRIGDEYKNPFEEEE